MPAKNVVFYFVRALVKKSLTNWWVFYSCHSFIIMERNIGQTIIMTLILFKDINILDISNLLQIAKINNEIMKTVKENLLKWFKILIGSAWGQVMSSTCYWILSWIFLDSKQCHSYLFSTFKYSVGIVQLSFKFSKVPLILSTVSYKGISYKTILSVQQ